MGSKNRLLANAARSTSYNIFLQIALRLLTFITNSFIVHYTTKDILGVVNVRLALLYTTAQFLSREPFRRACFSIQTDRNWTLVVNLLWLTVPIALLWSTVLGFVWLCLITRPDNVVIPGYEIGVLSVLVSVIVEMLAEPVFVISQLSQFIRLRVLIEGASLTIRCIIMAVLIMYSPKHGVYAFAIAQISASLLYSLSYFIFVKIQLKKDPSSFSVKTFRDLFPKIVPGNSAHIDMDLAHLTLSFFKQTCVKQLLTEGERYIMTMFNVLTFAEQGVYDIINNLGSLAARFIFQPIEDSGYIFFAQSLTRGKPIIEDPFASRVLENMIKIMLLLGSIILSFGTSYAKPALFLYGGKTLAEGLGPILLRWHCFYIIFLAINGPTECFVNATMDSKSIEKHNKMLFVLSGIFLMAAYFFTSIFGSVGFILANIFNMAARIAHSLNYISTYFSKQKPLRGLIPHLAIILVLFIFNQITWQAGTFASYEKGPSYFLVHVAIGGICLAITVFLIYILEKNLVQFIKTFLLKKED